MDYLLKKNRLDIKDCDRHYSQTQSLGTQSLEPPALTHLRSGNMFKRNSKLFAAALLVALASLVGVLTPALAAAPQHHDQVPGFFRLKVGDLEVTSLFDGPAVVDTHWLTGKKATLNGVVKALHDDPHVLDAADTGFLVNSGKQLVLVDAGSGTWFGG